MSTLGCLINNVMYTNFVCSNRKLLKYITSLLLWIQKIWSRTNYKIFSIDLRRNQVNFLVYGQHSKKKKKKSWSAGEIKIILKLFNKIIFYIILFYKIIFKASCFGFLYKFFMFYFFLISKNRK